MVPGDHLDLDARGLAGAHGLDRLGARRVVHGDDPEQDHVALQAFLGQLDARRAADRQHSQAGVSQFLGLSAVVEPGEVQDPLDRALHVHHVVRVPGRHEQSLGAERQHVHPFRHVTGVDSGLPRHHDERGLRRIADREPASVLLDDPRVVARQPREQALTQRRRHRRV